MNNISTIIISILLCLSSFAAIAFGIFLRIKSKKKHSSIIYKRIIIEEPFALHDKWSVNYITPDQKRRTHSKSQHLKGVNLNGNYIGGHEYYRDNCLI